MQLKSSAALLLAIAALLLPVASQAQSAPSPRQHILLDAGWRFHLDQTAGLKNGIPLSKWRWKADDNAPADAHATAAPGLNASGPDWKDAASGQDVFNGRVGYAWFRTTLPNLAGPNRTLSIQADDNADIYLNGVKLAHHEGFATAFDVPLDSAWKPGGPNVLAVLVQNTAGPGGLTGDIAIGHAQTVAEDPWKTAYDDRSWRIVHLPHDYVVEGVFTPTAPASHGSLPTHPAWYRKTFTLPTADKGKSVWIDFDGVYRDSIVYLNGQKLGEHQSGYTPFRYDISASAHYGALNTLAVSVDPTAQEGWWYEGGGIYRHVWLNIASPVHVAPWGTYIVSKLPEPVPGKPIAQAALTIQTTLDSPTGVSGHYRLHSRVTDPSGATVAEATSPVTIASSGQTFDQQATVSRPRLWSIEKPNMYRLHTELLQGNKIVDAYDTPFGIRTIRFDPNTGFYLNGKPVKIKGVCNHQDFAGVGIGVPDSLEYWRVAQLKKMGTNGWRTSHNPPTESVLDACDREGMVVMDENRHLGDTTSPKSGENTPYSDLSDLTTMILRDRNHPSIIMWSMCNEEFGIQAKPHGAEIFKAMRDDVRKYDTTRPVTCAMNGGQDSPVGISSVEDLVGINYNPGSYPPLHKQFPDKPVYGSETASTVSTRGVYSWDTFGKGRYTGEETRGWVSAYDVNAPPWAQTAEVSWKAQADAPYFAGGFAWTGFDYKGEPTPFAWPDINSNFGILDECGFPKDGFYYYKAWWTSQPVVHILPHWNWAGQEGQPIHVWVYSSAAKVDLIVNGVSQGSKVMPPNGHLEWIVPYAPGTVLAKGYDASGKLIATDKIETTGAPAALRLITDRTTLAADGEDMTPIEVDVVDAQGRIVPTADNKVTFTVTGAGALDGVGNGNPSDHDPDRADYRLAFNGKCLVNLGADSSPGPIHLTATSPGLKSANLTLTSSNSITEESGW